MSARKPKVRPPMVPTPQFHHFYLAHENGTPLLEDPSLGSPVFLSQKDATDFHAACGNLGPLIIAGLDDSNWGAFQRLYPHFVTSCVELLARDEGTDAVDA